MSYPYQPGDPRFDGAEAFEAHLTETAPVIAESNGHHWIEKFSLVCCRDCGFVRRADDQNKPCRGIVRVALR